MQQVDAVSFDAYHKWLAIPPHEQPPNHYRLLGVQLFEEDLDVIAAAADRQMAHIKSFTTGKYASHSQRLLNELAAARICLLNPAQKARYDTQLKRQSSISQQSEPILPPPELRIDAFSSRPYKSTRKSQKSPAVIVLIVVGGAMGLLAGYGALTLIKQQRGEIQAVQSPDEVARAASRPSHPDRKRQPFQRPKTIELRPLDAPVNNETAQPVAIVRRQVKQQPIPNLEDRIKQRKEAIDDPELAVPLEPEGEKLPQPSIVIPLTLDDPAILILATPDEVEVKDLHCDIGLSQNLLRNSGDPDVHEIVAERLGNRGKHTAKFAADVADCEVGLDISILHRSSAAVCDIRPRFSLPSGVTQPFTIRDLDKHGKLLTSLLSKVEGAKSSMPRLKATRDRQSQRASNASSGTNAGGANPAAAANARSAAQAQLRMAEAAIERAEKRIATAENWIGKESAIKSEQRALDGIREYANRIAADGSIYNRFYAGDTTIPATVK